MWGVKKEGALSQGTSLDTRGGEVTPTHTPPASLPPMKVEEASSFPNSTYAAHNLVVCRGSKEGAEHIVQLDSQSKMQSLLRRLPTGDPQSHSYIGKTDYIYVWLSACGWQNYK